MTVHPFRNPADSARFGGEEEVIQSHPLLPDARPPRFRQAVVWDLDGVVERPVNQKAANYRVSFVGLSPAWNLRAREMAMIWLNPRHPAVMEAGIHLKPDPSEPRTVALRAGTLRALAAWARDQGLPEDLHRWDREDFPATSITRPIGSSSAASTNTSWSSRHCTGSGLCSPAAGWPPTHGRIDPPPTSSACATRANSPLR
ncbi:hypothetical protein [Nocardia aurea]|uniref:hypothetical protein n=1 Tax=Nocardia aurea TaxID=2144174 RepID=UPI0013001FC1|nr:hypothetical protein [Nocardia aurea]